MTQVLVVDDSQFVRTALAAELGDRGYDVVTASDGEAAIEATVEREPDVVTMDVRMPGTDGIEAVQRIMARRPTPIVVLSAHTREGADATLDALSLGAMAVIPKPDGHATAGVSELADELAETIEAVRDADLASVTWERAAAAARTAANAERAVQAASAAVNGTSPPDATGAGASELEEIAEEPSSPDAAAADGSASDAATSTGSSSDAAAADDSPHDTSAADAAGTGPTPHEAQLPGGDPASNGDPLPTDGILPADGPLPADDPLPVDDPLPASDRSLPGSTVQLPASPDASPTIVLGASTGGPRILERVLSQLPRELNARVLIVQHMPASFTDRLARRLDGVSEYDVREASDGSRLVDGEALVARGGYHVAVRYAGDEHLRVRLTEDDHVHGVRPAIDVTMRTAAERVDGPLVGVALSGMGRDGADGVGAIARAGGATVVQDPASAPVEGIPRHAIATGDVDRMLPTAELASGIVDAALELTDDAIDDDESEGDATDGEESEDDEIDGDESDDDGFDGGEFDDAAADEERATERRDARAARPDGGDRGW